ncbi:MAG: DUF1361 domain-containing protein [Proteobacteria bacterium]|nr:DUF1361 domain-containing protein [Pseudomonadota bacterium]
MSYWTRFHRFNAVHGVYGVVLMSLLAAALLWGRFELANNRTFLFLAYNLVLAWIPYALSLVARIVEPIPILRLLLLPLMPVWLLFFPNAPYLVTDFVHLHERIPVPLWYDVGLLAVFASAGLILGLTSLSHMDAVVHRFLGGFVASVFVLGTTVLAGLGIYLGRFLRWNSWDILYHPQNLLGDVLHRLAVPTEHLGTWGVTGVFGLLFLIWYIAFSMRRNVSQCTQASS